MPAAFNDIVMLQPLHDLFTEGGAENFGTKGLVTHIASCYCK